MTLTDRSKFAIRLDIIEPNANREPEERVVVFRAQDLDPDRFLDQIVLVAA